MQRVLTALLLLAALTVQGQQTKPPAAKPSAAKPSATVPLPNPPPGYDKNQKPGPSTYDQFEEQQAKQEGFSPEQQAASLKLMKEVYPKEKAIATDSKRPYGERVQILKTMNADTDAQMHKLMPESMFLEWQAHNTLLESAYLAGINPITPKTIKTSEWAAHPAPKTKATPK